MEQRIGKVGYPIGVACVWLAVDADGAVGAFISGVGGPIPISALTHEPLDIIEVWDSIESRLPVRPGAPTVAPPYSPDLAGLASRGFFVFEWGDVNPAGRRDVNGYWRLATPARPLAITDLPEEFAALARKSPLTRFRFVEVDHFRQRDLPRSLAVV